MHAKKISAYVSVSYSEKEVLRGELNAIAATLAKFKIESFLFVDRYSFARDQERQMMNQAMLDIDKSDLVIIEATYKAIGIGVEAGYGKAKNKPVVYLRKKDADHSTTVSGISDFQIIYDNLTELQSKLENVIAKIIPALPRA